MFAVSPVFIDCQVKDCGCTARSTRHKDNFYICKFQRPSHPLLHHLAQWKDVLCLTLRWRPATSIPALVKFTHLPTCAVTTNKLTFLAHSYDLWVLIWLCPATTPYYISRLLPPVHLLGPEATCAIFFPQSLLTHSYPSPPTYDLQNFLLSSTVSALSLFLRNSVSSHWKHHIWNLARRLLNHSGSHNQAFTSQRSPEHQTLAIRSSFLYTDGRDHTGIAQLSLVTVALFGPSSGRFYPPRLVHAL